MRILIHRALSTSGYQVDVAATLAQARAMDPAGYDAVLVDAGLGPDRGMDLIESLRSEDPAADTIPAGVARLTKPFKLAELLTAVHALHQVPAARAAGSGAGVSSGSGT